MDGGEKKEVRRPMNAFLIFCKRHRGFVREKNPDMDNRSVTRVLGDLWANLGEEKKIYTNLAKQYKDAFMKANPNYKWHSADKSQCSSTKIISKPTNSRVIKNVAEIHTDGSIIPGKLADPDKMGGLNLLLMADKETCDSRSLSTSSTVFSLTRTPAASITPLPVQASKSSTEQQSSVSNSALLQLAEMCASELRGSSGDKPLPHLLTPLTLSIPPSSLPLLDSPKTPYQAMPPPKKRARHWSLTESDSSFETTNDNNSRDYTFGSMLLQNASLQKMRCTSVGSAVFSEDKFSVLEKYPPLQSRRKLSSSATESLPSPSGPCTDDVDSPVFSPELPFSGDPKSENYESFDQTPRNSSKQWSEKFETAVRGVHSHCSPLQEQPQKKLATPNNQSQAVLSLQCASANAVSKSGMWSERKEQLGPDDSQHAPCRGFLLRLHAAPSLGGTYEARDLDVRTEKGGSSDFYTWREPGKSKPKVVDTPHSPKVVSNSAVEPNSSPFLRLNHDGNLFENKKLQPRFHSTGDGKISLSGESRPESSLVVHEETSLSGLGHIKAASGPNNLHSPTAKLPLKFSHSPHNSLSTIGGDSHGLIKFPGNANETNPYNKIPEQTMPAQKITTTDVTKNGSLNFKDCNLKTEHADLTPVVQSTSQTFSEGKLKKIWAERMLNESRLNEDRTHQQTAELSAVVREDSLNVAKNSRVETNANQNLSPVDASNHESSSVKNLAESPSISSSVHSEPADSLISTTGHYLSSSNILTKPLEGIQNHHSPKALGTNSHSKLIPHSPQDHQSLKPTQPRPLNCSDMAKIKLKPDPDNLPVDQKLFHHLLHDNKLTYRKESAKCNEVHGRQDLNQITAYGKRFMDHVVEQLFKSDFSGDKPQIETKSSTKCPTAEVSDDKLHFETTKSSRKFSTGKIFDEKQHTETKFSRKCSAVEISDEKLYIETKVSRYSTGDFTKKGLLTEIKSEPAGDFEMKFKEESTCKSTKKEKVNNLTPAASSEEKVNTSTFQTEGPNSCRKTDQDSSRASLPVPDNGNPDASVPNHILTSSVEDSSKKLDSCKRVANSPPSDPCFQNQWLTVMPESCEQSDLNEEGGVQPLRKSRRPNRGQKYQELIKEGFIQPSRERLAARNADRHGRSFGSREEFEKMEAKRTLKRSVSERDAPLEGPTVSYSNGSNTALDASVEKRFTSGDFDLEKEIESLPVCSLDQLDKKKMFRRRCDSDTLGSPPPGHRNSCDTSNSLARTSSASSQAKLSPLSSSACKLEVDLCEPGRPAPHIPLPKEERPTEPITGSRKRKARKHCITRISVLDEKTSSSETAVDQKCVQPLPSSPPQKKLCCLPDNRPHNNGDNSSDSPKLLPQVALTSQEKLDHSTVACELKDSTAGSFTKTESPISLVGNIISTDGRVSDKATMSTFNTLPSPGRVSDKATMSTFNTLLSPGRVSDKATMSTFNTLPSPGRVSDKATMSTFNTLPSPKNGLTSSPQLLSSLSVVPPLNAVSSLLLSSNAPSESPLAFTVHRKNNASLLSPVPTPQHSIPKTSAIPLQSPKVPIHGDIFMPKSENNHSLVNKINSEDSYKHLVTLSTSKTKIPRVRVLSSEELHKIKSVNKKPKKNAAGRMSETSGPTPQSPVHKSHCPVKRKLVEKKISPVLSRSSNTPLVSALLGHSDLSSVIKLAERGGRRIISMKSSTSSGNGSSPGNTGGFNNMNLGFPFQVLSALNTQPIPLSVEQTHGQTLLQDSTSQGTASKSALSSSSNSTHRSSISASTPEAPPTSSEASSLSDRVPFFPCKSSSSSQHCKPHQSALLPTALTSSFITETVNIKPQLSLKHVGLVAPSSSPSNPDPHNSRAYPSFPHTGAILHNSLLNQLPSVAISSSSSSATCTNSTAFVSSTSSLLTLMPPHQSSSSGLPPTVISLAASAPSSKTDIVSYTVIGSSSVIDSGSPHMIGSPHLPESPSVAIVKS